MRIPTLFTFGFLLAAAALVTTVLITAPTSEASIQARGSTARAVTICETLPTGDIDNCTIQN